MAQRRSGEPGLGTGSGTGSARVERDEVTRAGYATLGAWAWFLYAFGPLLPALRAEEGISRTLTGLHSVALAIGAMIAGVLAEPLVRALRRRGAARLGLSLVVAGAVALCASTGPWTSLPSALLVGTGGSMLVNCATPILSDHHASAAPAVLSEGNALAAGVGVVAPLAVGAGIGLGWTWRPAVLLVVPAAGVVWWLLGRVPAGTPAVDGVLERPLHGRGRLPAVFWLLACAVVACVGIEFVCTAWSADLLRTRTGTSPGAASAAVTAVVGGMAAGRVLAGRLALRTPARRLLFAALGTTALGWLLTWTATVPWIAVTGLALTGLGIAAQYPLGSSLVLGSVPGQGDRATSKLSFGIGVSSGLSPFLVGALADATSTHTAFLVVPGLVVLAAALLLAAGGRAVPRRQVAAPRATSCQ